MFVFFLLSKISAFKFLNFQLTNNLGSVHKLRMRGRWIWDFLRLYAKTIRISKLKREGSLKLRLLCYVTYGQLLLSSIVQISSKRCCWIRRKINLISLASCIKILFLSSKSQNVPHEFRFLFKSVFNFTTTFPQYLKHFLNF